jgi:hypothetical protein
MTEKLFETDGVTPDGKVGDFGVKCLAKGYHQSVVE